MTTGHVFIATSVDGFVAREDHRIDWLTKQKTEGEEHGYNAFVATVDGIVMGRGSFENVLTFGDWPYTKPVIVMSRSMTAADLPSELAGKVELTAQAPAALMASLDARGWSRVYVDGGKVVQSFVRAGLIEDFHITTIPILIGQGLPLFGPLDADIDLDLLDTQAFPSGLVSRRYRVR